MIAYTHYPSDARIRREAEALSALQDYRVTLLTPKHGAMSAAYDLNNVHVVELNVSKYQGKSQFQYLLSYLLFLAAGFREITLLFVRKRIDIVHVHNMPNLLILAAIIPRLLGRPRSAPV